jgi:membrane fusion protein, macrolide-specific efflux system
MNAPDAPPVLRQVLTRFFVPSYASTPTSKAAMTERTGRPWLNYPLGLLCVGAIVAAILVVGPASGGQTARTRTAKVARGVVQATVSGSGNLQPAAQLNLGFKTGGTVSRIYATQGEYVTEGRLLAELDPSSAEVALEQARANLRAAEAKLAQEEETGGEPSTSRATTSTLARASSKEVSKGKATHQGASEETESSSSSSSSSTLSAATREANLASARAAVKSDELTVRGDEEAVANTKLYAPRDGTIVTLSGQVGEVVSASGTTRASSTSSSGSGSAASGASSGRSAAGAGSTGSTGSSASAASSGSSSTTFAVLSDLSSMQLVVALSESEIGSVKVGQIATVTIEALGGRKLAAHVSEVATLSTSSSGVVSYDVTFQLDQMEAGLKPGMSATAEVVVKQAEGVNVPSSAISGGSVTVVRGGNDARQRVVTGLAGNSSTIVLSGLKAGETVVLPAAVSTSFTTSLTSRLSRLGGGGGGLTGGGAAFFRGGG